MTQARKPTGNTHMTHLVTILCVEDDRVADELFAQYNRFAEAKYNGKPAFMVTRITHSELQRNYVQYMTATLRADYDLLWINTPTDYHTRSKAIATGPKPHTLLHNTTTLITKMIALSKHYVVLGPPGPYWNTFQQFGNPIRLRFCTIKLRFNIKDPRPSGSYIQMLTNCNIPHTFATCKCRQDGKMIPISDHVLDWFHADTLEHRQWRQKAREVMMRVAFTAVLRHSQHLSPSSIRDLATGDSENFVEFCTLFHCGHISRTDSEDDTPEAPQVLPAEVLPTEARIRQKEKLKADKEKGIAPKKKKIPVEDGNDDCGDDISGLGDDVALLAQEMYNTDSENDTTGLTSYIGTNRRNRYTLSDFFTTSSDAVYLGHSVRDFYVEGLDKYNQPRIQYGGMTNLETIINDEDVDLLRLYLLQSRVPVLVIRPQVCSSRLKEYAELMMVQHSELHKTVLAIVPNYVIRDARQHAWKMLPQNVFMLKDTTYYGEPYVYVSNSYDILNKLPSEVGDDLSHHVNESILHVTRLCYPGAAASTSPSDHEPADPPPRSGGIINCPACRNKIWKHSPRHTRRRNECQFPDIEPDLRWENCEGCKMDLSKERGNHSYKWGECRWAPDPAMQGSARRGKHPTAPRHRGTAEATAGSASHEQAPHEGVEPPTAPTPAPPTPPADTSIPVPTPGQSSSGNPQLLHRYGQSRMNTPPTRQDEPQLEEIHPDWTRFDIQISLQNLRSQNPGMLRRELRKLHLRWWHASASKMETILRHAGVKEQTLSMIPSIVDTCRECRLWQERGHKIQQSTHISTKMGEEIEIDLFFYRRKTSIHIIDRCTRFTAARMTGEELSGKDFDTLSKAYSEIWLCYFEPPKLIIVDGEGALNSDRFKDKVGRGRTKIIPRAPDQHAVHIERRNAILRHTLHLLEAELKRHNIVLPFPELLSEANFVCNAFTFIGGVSPYNAVFGRQPAFLPDLQTLDYNPKGETLHREREERIRAAAIQAITQTTATAKINRATRTKSSDTGHYKVGDVVDYFRENKYKDSPGWHGPFEIAEDQPESGKAVVRKDDGTLINVAYRDLRHTLCIQELWLTEDDEQIRHPFLYLLTYIGAMHPGRTELYGYAEGALQAASKNNLRIHACIQFVIQNVLRVENVMAVRIGRCLSTTRSIPGATGSTLYYWRSLTNNKHRKPIKYVSELTNIDIAQLCGTKTLILQCIHSNTTQFHTLNQELSRAQNIVPRLVKEPTTTPQPQEQPSNDRPGRLETIDEGEDEDDDDTLLAVFTDLQSVLTTDIIYDEWTFIPTYPSRVMDCETFLMTTNDGDVVVPWDSGVTHQRHQPEEVLVDDHGDRYVELDIDPKIHNVFPTEDEARRGSDLPDTTCTPIPDGLTKTLRIYVTKDAKRAVVVKTDDLLSKQEILQYPQQIAEATKQELQIWITNACFKKALLQKGQNLMTSRYVVKWKYVKDASGKEQRIIRMRLVLRGFMDHEAFSLDTYSGTAKRQSQRILASEAACHPEFILASLDIDKAFLKGFTYKELADATGEKERDVFFILPPGSATVLRQFPGFADYDESRHCLQCIKPGTGTKDAPRAFSMKLNRVTKKHGLQSTSYDPEFEFTKTIRTAKHVDDINMTGTDSGINEYIKLVEATFGTCKVNRHNFTCVGVRFQKTDDGDVILDQDAYIKTMRPIIHADLTGADPETEATKPVQDMFVSLRGALAYTALTQAWILVYIVSLQRVQIPSYGDVRRLNAVVRKLQQVPKRLVFKAMKPTGLIDLHTDAGYRRLTGDKEDELKGYGMRGLNVIRTGQTKKGEHVVHLIDTACKSHRLTVRSSYGAEAVAAAHGVEDAWPTLVTLHELMYGTLTSVQLKQLLEVPDTLRIQPVLTTDAESVYKSLTSRDLKIPTEKTLLGHIQWLRDLLSVRIIKEIRWCDTRDMSADGHTKGSIDRELLLKLMEGSHTFVHPIKTYVPTRKREPEEEQSDDQDDNA